MVFIRHTTGSEKNHQETTSDTSFQRQKRAQGRQYKILTITLSERIPNGGKTLNDHHNNFSYKTILAILYEIVHVNNMLYQCLHETEDHQMSEGHNMTKMQS